MFDVCARLSHVLQVLRRVPEAVRDRRWRARRRRPRADPGAQTAAVMDDCFQCKQCEVNCPYSPRDAHPFARRLPQAGAPPPGAEHARPGVSRCASGCSPTRMRWEWRRGSGAGWPTGSTATARTACCWRRRWASTATSSCPTFAPRTFEAWAVEAGLTKGAPGRRGGAVPELLRRQQRARHRPRHRRGAARATASTSAAARPRLLRHAGLGVRRPARAAPARAAQPRRAGSPRRRGQRQVVRASARPAP